MAAGDGQGGSDRVQGVSTDSAPLSADLAGALMRAVQLRKEAGTDTSVLEAFQTIAEVCCRELAATQDDAIAAAERALTRLHDATALGDRRAIKRSYGAYTEAVAHAEQVSTMVIATLSDLLGGFVEVSADTVARMQRAVAVTDALLAEAGMVAARPGSAPAC